MQRNLSAFERRLDPSSSRKFDILTYGSNEVPSIAGFREYMAEVSSDFCPYIEPSITTSKMSFTVVHSDADEITLGEEIVFASAHVLTELLRYKRALSQSSQHVPLLCENILFLFPRVPETMHKDLLSWPHWVLKCKYTQLGILFGKFWKGANETSKSGRNLPTPPCHLLSIRESVRAKDPKFFQQAEWLLPSLESANDVGQNVFCDAGQYRDITESLSAFVHKASISRLTTVMDRLVGSGLYLQAKALAAIELQARKNHDLN